jgi:2-keto-4-pentenoate hydratase/2-oxohepta-3-ene-1,7-dioic acid hydratase in catechol pathway
MRFARFVHPGGVSFGVVEGEAGADPSALTVAEIDKIPFEEVRYTGKRWALPDVRLQAPIFSSKVVCVGRNYADHAAEHGAEVPKEPLIFLKPSTSVIGPRDTIRLPPQSKQV